MSLSQPPLIQTSGPSLTPNQTADYRKTVEEISARRRAGGFGPHWAETGAVVRCRPSGIDADVQECTRQCRRCFR